MATVDPVILQIRADLGNFQARLAQAERLADQRLGGIERRGEQMTSGLRRSFNLASTAALSFVSAATATAAARDFLRIADTAKQIEAQLRLATRETGNFAQAQADVQRIAMGTYSSLESTAQLYATFQRNAEELGITQEQAARATETVTKAFQISGASAAEAAGGLRQFLQGVQSGTLRGEELNSVLENAPRLAQLLADSLGVTIDQLRKMGAEGELTGEKLIAALTDQKFFAQIDEEARQLPITFEKAMTNVETAATKVFGAFDRGGQFSTMLANFIADGADGFAKLETAAESFGATVSAEFAGFIGMVNAAYGAVENLANRMLNMPAWSPFGAIGWVGQQAKGSAGQTALRFLNPVGSLVELGMNSPAANEARDQRVAELSMARVMRGDVRSQYLAQGGMLPSPPKPPRPAGSSAKPKATGSRGPSAETLAKRAEREQAKQIRDEFNSRRETARMDADILAARAALATATDDILRFELQSIDAEKSLRLDQINTDVKLGDLTEEQAAKMREGIGILADLNAQRAQRSADEAKAVMEANRLRDTADTLQAEAQLLRSREARAEVEQRILDFAYQEEEAAIRRAAANGDIANLDEALANLRRRQLADQEMVRRGNMSPGERYVSDIAEEAENLGDAYEDIAVKGLERMNRSFAEATKKALGLHGVLGDIIGDMIELAFRQQILGPLSKAIFGDSEGGGLLGGLLGSIFGGVTGKKALGGPVMAGGTYLVGERGPELLRMGGSSGFVIPNHALRAATPQGGGVAVVRLELTDDLNGRIVSVAGPIAVEVTRANAPAIADMGAAKAMKAISRPRM